ncbi:MAG: NADH-ubiquinone oxidoreductase-F iron-sulfur binding region domain-containing protein [Dehalococcoidia bacterium]
MTVANSTLRDIILDAKNAWAAERGSGKIIITVSIDTSSIARRAEDTFAALRERVAARRLDVAVGITGSWGLNWMEPTLTVRSAAGTLTVLYGNITADRVDELLDRCVVAGDVWPQMAIGTVEGLHPDVAPLAEHQFMRGQVRRLMRRMGTIDPENINHYLADGGYEGLGRALEMSDEAIIKEMLDSGVGGRGGANFPVGRKWDFLRTATASPKYLVCNADEGDPGAWVNRAVMECDPHLIIEGLLIAARATGAREGYVYIRYEYPLAIDRMRNAVKQAMAKGLLGTNILGLGWDFDIVIFKGAGSYVCGDETGLINSIDGYRGMPRIKPPFPAQAGLWNKPTNVNNVESYANAPLILANGAQWWCELNPKDQPEKGTKMFTLSGQINWIGCLEIPFGSGTMKQMLDQYGNGMLTGTTLKGFQPGGPLSGVLPASEINLPLQLAPYRERGMFLGGGGITFFDSSMSALDLILWMTSFCEDESCGRCTTCHGGNQRAVELLRRIALGGGRESDLDKLGEIVKTLVWSNCQHGQLSPTAIKTAVRFFRGELEALIREKRDVTRSLPGFIRYTVRSQSDPQLAEAVEICPTGAIVEDARGQWQVEDPLCVLCGACKEVAPDAIAIVDRIQRPVAGAAAAAGA